VKEKEEKKEGRKPDETLVEAADGRAVEGVAAAEACLLWCIR